MPNSGVKRLIMCLLFVCTNFYNMKNCVLANNVFVFIDSDSDSDYFIAQHWLFGICGGHGVGSVWGGDWVLYAVYVIQTVNRPFFTAKAWVCAPNGTDTVVSCRPRFSAVNISPYPLSSNTPLIRSTSRRSWEPSNKALSGIGEHGIGKFFHIVSLQSLKNDTYRLPSCSDITLSLHKPFSGVFELWRSAAFSFAKFVCSSVCRLSACISAFPTE
jgi:hypothetical protein